MEMKQNKRIVEYDIAKGVCILLMVIGHSGIWKMTGVGLITYNMIYAFHMPFFFFISGVTTDYSKDFWPFVKRRFKSLLVPFMCYYVIHLPCYTIINDCSMIELFIREMRMGVQGALWFVPILFLSQLICRLVPKTQFLQMVSVVILSTVSSALCINDIHLPWHLSVLGISAAYVVMGRMMTGGGISMSTTSKNYYQYLIGIIVLAAVTILISSKYPMRMYFDIIEPCMIIMAGAVSGIMMVIMLAFVCNERLPRLSRFLSYTGVNTFAFIAFSQIILVYENYYIRDYIVLKYVILFLALYGIIYVKNLFPFAKKLRL